MRSLQIHLCASVAAAASAAGCSVYDHRYEYQPGPQDIEAAVPGASDQQPVRVLVSVMGVRRPGSQVEMAASVEVRLRIENFSDADVLIDPASFALFSADLQQFPAPHTVPPEPLQLLPRQSAVVTTFFPFPEGKVPGGYDLNGLNVRWTLYVGDRPVTSSASFGRLPEAYYDRYPARIGVGYQRYDS